MAKSFNIDDNDALRRTPFTVPEGYFSQLEKDIMARTAEKPVMLAPKSRYRWLKPMIGVAASVCILFIGGAVYMNSAADDESAQMENTNYDAMLKVSNNEADYIMLDNEDIYSYISGNNL